MLKRWKIISLIITILIIIISCAFLFIYEQNKNYTKINKAQKELIKKHITACMSLDPDLKSNNAIASWKSGNDIRKQLMNGVLESLIISGESKNDPPNQFYKATYYTDQEINVYIDKQKKNPYNSIIVGFSGHYYIGKAKKAEVNKIMNYMRSNGL